MPMINELVLEEVPIGPASDFRGTINSNFEAVKTAVENEFTNVYNQIEQVVDIELSSTQPANQKVGDIWLKEL